jgi:uncharacterized membrane protein YvbJ
MVRCPKCFKFLEDQSHCTNCGKIKKHTNEELFDKLGEAVENELRKELRRRKMKKL